MKVTSSLSIFLLVTIVLLGTAQAETVTIKFKNDDKDNRRMKDYVVKFTNAKVTSVTNKDGFATNSAVPAASIGFDGGDIAPGAERSVIVETDRSAGSKWKWLKTSYTNGDEATTSNLDDIFSTVRFGGQSGLDFAGVHIPTQQYGYFYQFDRNSLFAQSPDRFEIIIGGGAPTSSGWLSNTWSVASLLDDRPQDTVNDGSIIYSITDDMTPGDLTGIPGISPDSWLFSGGKMIATYSTLFNVNDVASVLWFTHPGAPDVGGPLGIEGNNAALFGDELLFTNAVSSPVPEPSSLVVLGTGICGMLGFVLRRRKMPR